MGCLARQVDTSSTVSGARPVNFDGPDPLNEGQWSLRRSPRRLGRSTSHAGPNRCGAKRLSSVPEGDLGRGAIVPPLTPPTKNLTLRRRDVLFLANMPLDVHALDDTYAGICELKAGCLPDTELHPEVLHHKIEFGERREIGGFAVEFIQARTDDGDEDNSPRANHRLQC